MDVYVQSMVGECSEAVIEGKRKTVSIVISPLKLVQRDKETLKVISGCNLWKACQNLSCQFSLANREEKG
jgi:hypothetical protein